MGNPYLACDARNSGGLSKVAIATYRNQYVLLIPVFSALFTHKLMRHPNHCLYPGMLPHSSEIDIR